MAKKCATLTWQASLILEGGGHPSTCTFLRSSLVHAYFLRTFLTFDPKIIPCCKFAIKLSFKL